MKKLFLIFIAVMCVALPVFAASETLPKTETVNVKLSIERESKYYTGINKTNMDSVTDWNPIKSEDVVLKRTENTMTFAQDGTYYLNYKFYEFVGCHLDITTNGNMKSTDTSVSDTIPFKVTVAAGTDVLGTDSEGNVINSAAAVKTIESKTIYSDGDGTDKMASATVVTYEETKVVGDYVFGSLGLTVAPTEDNPLLGKKISSYVGNIVLTVTQNS